MDYFLAHLILTSKVATRLTAKVRETVEKQFITEIKMSNRFTSFSARDCNYCLLCLRTYGVGADSCYCYPIIKCSKWGKGRMPSHIHLFWCISRSKNTKKRERNAQAVSSFYEFLIMSVWVGGFTALLDFLYIALLPF
jgi:hypothetical protein